MVGRGRPVGEPHVVTGRHDHHEVGGDPPRTLAPLACQLGKYETFTSTGVPTRETWKATVESVVVTADDLLSRACASRRA